MNPVHLVRRGAVYLVRFRIPRDLVSRVGVVELKRSLHTREIKEARRRCLLATVWFRAEMERQRRMEPPSRQELEAAAREFFAKLARQYDGPRNFNLDNWDQEVAFNIETSEDLVKELDVQLIGNQFGPSVMKAAASMATQAGFEFDAFDDRTTIVAAKLAALALREEMRFFIHQLTSPAQPFKPTNPVFEEPAIPDAWRSRSPIRLLDTPSPPLGQTVEEYLRKTAARGVGGSRYNELARPLRWLREAVGEATQIEAITKERLRGFRDDLQRLGVGLRGRDAPFADRLTNIAADQIKPVTALRYWKAVQSFFQWCASEGMRDDDPSLGLKLQVPVGIEPRRTEPFSDEELRMLFRTPLYAGYKSAKRLSDLGVRRVREAHWWAPVLSLHTGLRAGELSQLLPEDFVFDGPVPHLKVRKEDAQGNKVKRTKTAASTRDVPLLRVLMDLGLRQFVESRWKRYPKARVFQAFRLGQGDRLSDGMTRYWGDYFKKFGLWKPGRSTHVFRHTVVDRLRAAGATDDDIGAVLGHSGRSVTSRYGGPQPLERKAETLGRLSYGLDVNGELGGPYDAKLHAS
jgi:integrase